MLIPHCLTEVQPPQIAVDTAAASKTFRICPAVLEKAKNRMSSGPVVHVVDDDPSFRSAISRLLKIAGYQVADYETAAFFLQNIKEAKPGCLLLDVQMPSLNGLQLQEELAKLSPDWPIIFMTAHGDIPTSVRAIKAGAEDFLAKPVAKDTLLPAIERALVRSECMRESQSQQKSLKSPGRDIDGRGKRSFFLDGARQIKQADCPRTGYVRANRQGPSASGYAKAAGSIICTGRFCCGARRIAGGALPGANS